MELVKIAATNSQQVAMNSSEWKEEEKKKWRWLTINTCWPLYTNLGCIPIMPYSNGSLSYRCQVKAICFAEKLNITKIIGLIVSKTRPDGSSSLLALMWNVYINLRINIIDKIELCKMCRWCLVIITFVCGVM